MKKCFYFAFATLLMTMPLTGCSSDEEIVKDPEVVRPDDNKTAQDEGENKDDPNPNGDTSDPNTGSVVVRSISLTDSQKEAVTRNNDFTFNFYRALNKTDGLKGKSNVVSPLSLTYVLGMLNAGATGQTSSEILKLLGYGDNDSQALNDLCKELIDNAPIVDESVKLRLADLVATASNQSITLADDYSKTVKDYYDGEAVSLDFTSQAAVDFINGWCSEKTEGMIPSIISKDNLAASLLVLLNTVYFNAPWTHPFDKAETKDMEFTREDGVKVTLPMMHREDAVCLSDEGAYQVLGLSYGEGQRWTMYILLPHEGKTVDDVLAGLSAKRLEEYAEFTSLYVESGMATDVDVLLPRFKSETSNLLNDVIAGMGAPSMFKPMNEFTGMSTSPQAKDLFVGLIKQNAAIEVSEAGTEAAAATIAMMCTSTGEHTSYTKPTFHADHPFVYLIQEASSGAVFFIGTYQGE